MAYAVQTISSLPFAYLIGAPMTAAIQAQAQAAKTTVDFIQEVGFNPPAADVDPLFPDAAAADNPIGEVRNISFSYTTTGQDGGPRKASLTVPLLTVVPIPYFAIEEMTIDFMAKITESFCKDKIKKDEKVKAGSGGAGFGWGPVTGGLRGSYSSKHSSTASSSSKYQTEMTMNIHVRAKQDDMPAGLARMLDILSSLVKEQLPPAAAVVPAGGGG